VHKSISVAGMARSWYSMLIARRPVATRAARALCLVALLPGPTLLAAELAVTQVDFAPAVSDKLKDYGDAEGATLTDAIVAAVNRRSAQCAVAPGLALTVTVEDLAPSRLTRKQLDDNPSLDVERSKSLGGAELKGEVRDARQRVLTTVSYRYFAPTITVGSPARDPWADARLAIDGFAEKLASACRDLPR
jgi:hypothetical protein